MFLQTNPKIRIEEYQTPKKRFTTLKFYLKKLDFGIYLPRKKIANTYFFCQRVDICFTDNNNRIIHLHSNVKSEKLIFHFNSHNVYYFPLGTCNQLKRNSIIPIK